MSVPKLLTTLAALAALLVVAIIGYLLLRPPVALLSGTEFDKAQISPNADGVDDLTTIRYSLARSAQVSIYLDSDNGQRFYFRQNERRTKGDYSVLFSGVVDGYTLPGEAIEGRIERRLIPNGHYTWTIEAVGSDETKRTTGTLAVVNADSALPIISAFEIDPDVFTPNQDGVRDRTDINVYLEKPADLNVYLQDAEGQQYYLSEREKGREPGDMGNHQFDYDGGVDQGMEPPEDGTYTVYAVVQDAEGQRIVREGQLTLQDGGLPRAEIVPQTAGAVVLFETATYDEEYYTDSTVQGDLIPIPEGIDSSLETITMPLGDMLVFKLTISNYGTTSLRTAGPFPGTVYDFTQKASTLEAYEQSGAWRVGIDCDTAYSDYPWRWALGPHEELETVYDEAADETYYYLRPGQRAEVWGAIRMSEIRRARNPQDCWAGLIHEDVGVAPSQSRVGAREVELVAAIEDNSQ